MKRIGREKIRFVTVLDGVELIKRPVRNTQTIYFDKGRGTHVCRRNLSYRPVVWNTTLNEWVCEIHYRTIPIERAESLFKKIKEA